METKEEFAPFSSSRRTKVGQEVAVPADGSVDPAADPGPAGEQTPVERLAHAVQALELVALAVAGAGDDLGDGERVVGGELRVEPRTAPAAGARHRR